MDCDAQLPSGGIILGNVRWGMSGGIFPGEFLQGNVRMKRLEDKCSDPACGSHAGLCLHV